MSLLSKTAFAALLLGSTIAAPAFAASPDTTGCPAGMHRADSEGGNPQFATRKADSEGGNPQFATRKADSEGGNPQFATRKADSEGGNPQFATRKADSEGGPHYQQQASAAAPCIK
jgi:hypothetical protein